LNSPPNNVSCFTTEPWSNGSYFGNKLKSIKTKDSSTGSIQFNANKGSRTNLTFSINENIKNDLYWVTIIYKLISIYLTY
jgi:hypothetical protein